VCETHNSIAPGLSDQAIVARDRKRVQDDTRHRAARGKRARDVPQFMQSQHGIPAECQKRCGKK
jgi:hypothetical protein